MFSVIKRIRTRPIAATTIAAIATIAGTMIVTPAAAQDGYYTDEAWWNVTEWFDGNDTAFEEYDDDGYGDDTLDEYGYDDSVYDDSAYAANDDWSSDDADYGYGYDADSYGYDSDSNSLNAVWYETGYDDTAYWNDYQSSPYDYDYYSNEWYDDDGAFGVWYDGWGYN